MVQIAKWLSRVVIVLGFMSYQLLVYQAFRDAQNNVMHWLLLLLPLLLLAVWVTTRSTNKHFWLFTLFAVSSLVYFFEQRERLGLVVVHGAPHVAVYTALLWVFGRTLLPGKEALITRLARRVHETLPAEMEIYTRHLTFIWCVFFIAQIIGSVLFYRFTSLEIWSLFVNLLNFPLLALMFIGDYLYRIVRFRYLPQPSIFKAIRLFAEEPPFRARVQER